jgi:hypothetical protein
MLLDDGFDRALVSMGTPLGQAVSGFLDGGHILAHRGFVEVFKRHVDFFESLKKVRSR